MTNFSLNMVFSAEFPKVSTRAYRGNVIRLKLAYLFSGRAYFRELLIFGTLLYVEEKSSSIGRFCPIELDVGHTSAPGTLFAMLFGLECVIL